MEKKIFSSAFLCCLCTLLLSSCANTKQVTYFNNLVDTLLPASADAFDPVIQKGDLLSISVSSLNSEVTTVFNVANTPANTSSVSGNNMLSQAVGYLVSQDGYIDFPMLGSIKAVGLRKEALKELITRSLEDKKLLFNPVVSVRYLNYHITVLGEVNNPGVVTIPNEQISVLEAIGLAGDLTIYGKRDNVLLIRKEDGRKIAQRLDLNSDKLLTSPYYYLKSNDVLYVQPGSNKVLSASQSRMVLPMVLSALSFLIIVVDHVF